MTRVSNLPAGVFLYLPLASGSSCPRRLYTMSSYDVNWTPLVHKYLRGMQRQKQEGVAFRDFQLSYTENGMFMKLRRDVRTTQMLSAAVQTDADMSSRGIYDFEIQTASGQMRAVTSVVFFDGPKGVFADYTPVLFDGDTPRLADSGRRNNGLRIIDTGLPGDTSLKVPEEELQERRGFGFQIHPNTSFEGRLSDWVVLWSAKSNKSLHSIFALQFDSTKNTHSYTLAINQDQSMGSDQYWELKLYIDKRQRALMSGATSISSRSLLTVGVYNRHGWVAPLDDAFNPPETAALVRKLTLPAASTELCRFGEPFRGRAHPVVEFLAAVGTTAFGNDVSPYQKITRPCIPCQHMCDELVCNTTCVADQTRVVHVDITNLTLQPRQIVTANNETHLQIYYLTVKAVTASGQFAIASTAGVYIDTTPPLVEALYHIDLSWSQEEPSNYQGDNSSIAVYYQVFDGESEVVETWWAIGSVPGGTDVQPFVKITADMFVSNTSLEGLLLENHTYYVTLMCINGAGLKSTNISQGTTIMTMSPSAADVPTTEKDTEQFGDEADTVPARKTSRQDSVGVGWEKAPQNEHIDGIYFSVGSEEGNADVFPERQVGLGEYAGEVSLSSEGITFSSGSNETANETVNHRKKRDMSGTFFMEPGRTLRVHLRACTKAHKCSQMSVKPIVIVRDADIVAKTKGGILKLTLGNDASSTAAPTVVATKPQSNDKMLVGGILSDADVNSQYMSEASNSFKPFIVNPEATKEKTDRYLRKRIHHWDGKPLFISTLPGQIVDGPLDITMPFDKTRLEDFMHGFHPRILRWCTDDEMWIDAGRTCNTDDNNRRIDWKNGLVTVTVCHNDAVCGNASRTSRSKRDIPSVNSQGVAMYSAANTANTFSNSPPTITSESTVRIFEDVQFQFGLTAEDPDSDPLSFILNTTAPSPMGNVSLATDGMLSYTPCANCYGTDTVHFTVWEKRTDQEQPLYVDGQLVVEISATNDVPRLVIFNEGRDINPPSSVVTMTVEENTRTNAAYRDLVVVVAAYDADYNDDVTLAFDQPQHGNLSVYSQVNNVGLIPQDCAQTWESRRRAWDKLVDDISTTAAVNKRLLPNPCDTEMINQRLAWVITVLRYTPFEGYFGDDIIKVTATDRMSQDLMTIDLRVLKNPCINKGICQGPETDPECTSTNRTNGFDGYFCRCPRGYTGNNCETEIDECMSDPCPANYTCINGIGAYECYCNPKWSCHVIPPLLESWHVVMISVGSVLVFIFAGIAVVCIWMTKKRAKTRRPKHSAGSSSTASTIRHGPFRSRWLYGFQSPQQRQAGYGAQALGHRLPTSYGHTNPAYVGSQTTDRRSDERVDSSQSTELKRQHNRRQPGAHFTRPKNALFRPMGHRPPKYPLPDYD